MEMRARMEANMEYGAVGQSEKHPTSSQKNDSRESAFTQMPLFWGMAKMPLRYFLHFIGIVFQAGTHLIVTSRVTNLWNVMSFINMVSTFLNDGVPCMRCEDKIKMNLTFGGIRKFLLILLVMNVETHSFLIYTIDKECYHIFTFYLVSTTLFLIISFYLS